MPEAVNGRPAIFQEFSSTSNISQFYLSIWMSLGDHHQTASSVINLSRAFFGPSGVAPPTRGVASSEVMDMQLSPSPRPSASSSLLSSPVCSAPLRSDQRNSSAPLVLVSHSTYLLPSDESTPFHIFSPLGINCHPLVSRPHSGIQFQSHNSVILAAVLQITATTENRALLIHEIKPVSIANCYDSKNSSQPTSMLNRLGGGQCSSTGWEIGVQISPESRKYVRKHIKMSHAFGHKPANRREDTTASRRQTIDMYKHIRWEKRKANVYVGLIGWCKQDGWKTERIFTKYVNLVSPSRLK
ncbi:unnamed protein product [Protopolystoma xenopodis]|uniref:Uncharacterized protein n=1 Tax=Protopolystoma xenopodis TaxID=117903 RepID=A0A448XMK2_9PLAT|nr:unnamed protein product [Protopolystoma xenopodis]